jgi:hypothetical protein
MVLIKGKVKERSNKSNGMCYFKYFIYCKLIILRLYSRLNLIFLYTEYVELSSKWEQKHFLSQWLMLRICYWRFSSP